MTDPHGYEAATRYLQQHVDLDDRENRWLLNDEDVRGLAEAIGAAGRAQAGTGPGQPEPTDNARLSKLLFTAREAIEMLADIVSARTHQNPLHLRELVCEIDNYRADRGWSPHGFGGET